MSEFFGNTSSGGPFVLFSAVHWAAIIVIVLFNLSFLLLRRLAKPEMLRAWRYTMAAVLIVNEIAWHIWNLSIGKWTVQTMLPLHICSVFVFLSAYMLVKRSYPIYELAYFLGIGAASQAVLTPDLGEYGYPHFRYFQTFISHGLIVSAAIYMTLVEGFRPTWRSYGRVLVWTNVYMLFVGMINWLIGSNYMFIAHKPDTPSLIDMLGPWPWYILALEAIGFGLFLLLYLPFAIGDILARRAASPQPFTTDR